MANGRGSPIPDLRLLFLRCIMEDKAQMHGSLLGMQVFSCFAKRYYTLQLFKI